MNEKYFDILNLPRNASLNDIKKAYRGKAKNLHPDRNKSPNAHEEFVELNEAYEYLLAYKTGKLSQRASRGAKRETRRKRDWSFEEREAARSRAKAYANMRYKEYTNTSFYKNAIALNVLLDFATFIFSICVTVFIPIFGFIEYHWNGLISAIIIIVITVPIWKAVYIDSGFLKNLEDVVPAFLRIIKTTTFKTILVVLVHFVVFFQIGMNTFIALSHLTGAYAMCIGLGYLFFYQTKNTRMKSLKALGVFPSVLSILLLVNFLFSSNPKIEKHSFKLETYIEEGRRESTTSIKLAGDKYDNYGGLRSFFSMGMLKNKREITMTIEEGALGYRVLKAYQLK